MAESNMQTDRNCELRYHYILTLNDFQNYQKLSTNLDETEHW